MPLFTVQNTSQFIAVSLLSMVASTVFAESDLLSEEELFGEIPMSLTATRISQSVKDSPVSITIITREMIEAYGATELPDVLRLVPGFQVSHVRGYRSSISYHGLGSEYSSRLQVQIDGRSVYTPILGNVEWPELPVEQEDIERIEVIRGPNAASYGANSFAAVVNIITRHASDTLGTYAKITQGSRNTNRYLARFGGHSGRLDYRATASYARDSGFRDTEFPDDKEISSFNYRADYQPNLDDQFEFQFGYRSSVRQDGDVEPFDDSQVDPKRKVNGRTHFQLLRWRHEVDPKENFSVQFYHNYQRIDDDFQTDFIDSILGAGTSAALGVPDQRVNLSNSRLMHRYDLEFQHNLEMNDNLKFVWGASARYEQSGSASLFDRDSNRDFITNNTYRLFGHSEWKPDAKWTINAGALIENNDITGTDVSPRFAINHHFSANHTVRASVSRAYRTPSVLESNADSVSSAFDASGNRVEIDQLVLADRKLEPEEITSFELAYIGNFPKYALNIDAKFFYDKIKNTIDDIENRAFTDPFSTRLGLPANKDRVFFYDNVGDILSQGFEAQLQYKLNPDTSVHMAYTNTRVKGKLLSEINRNFIGDQGFDAVSVEAPRVISSIQLIHDLQPDIRTSFSAHHYSQYNFAGGNATGPFSILNVRIAKKFRFEKHKGQLALTFQNLFDDYYDYEREQVFQKRIYLSLEYGLN